MDRIIITDESLNSYGFRVLTSGAVLDRFLKNPVLLYDHNRWGLPLGKWNDLSIESGRITAVPEFDPEDEEAMKVANKYEKKYLNSASIGFRILATSEDPEDMLPGQTLPTVTKWELYEVSLTPIPANGNAIRLYDDKGNTVDLHDPAQVQLALKTPNLKTVENSEKLSFEQKALAWLFGKLGVKKEDHEAAEESPQHQPEERGTPQLSELAAQLADLNTQLDSKVQEVTQLKTQYQQDLAAKDIRIQQLEAEVKKLSQTAADEEADGKSEHDHRQTHGTEVMLPQTLSAIEYFQKLKPTTNQKK